MPGIPPVDIAQGVLGLGTAAVGLLNEGKEKREAERLAANRPKIGIDPLVNQDLNLAESELGSNVTAGERAYEQLNNGQFSSAIGSALKSGADPNNIGSIYGNSEDGRLKLAMMKDNLRLQQINNFVTASRAKQDANQTEFLVDQYGPYQDKVQANASARQGSQLQVTQGLNSFGSAIGNAGQSIQENNAFALPKFPVTNNNNGYVNDIPVSTNNTNFYNPNVVLPVQRPQYSN